ncbi:chemotaxis protein CheD [Desulfuribacillus stibiiarsenatis]|uniref:Probable chemoreceptor glutamine deamidase CheD n=1 Tax=Desulfuribacillus stibiiarsenatis TaxID=1390249 RepID=A0A1E5L6I2_9FIRM|nr:chemotaxis protein CheD [Desulfuribacillus stibiiarsenatis]OEH85609.1 chemotaxis protein CheD [Desulfuribacillus stibiiarsenatis]
MEVVKVWMADSNVAKFPNSIRTTGLGSCVGVTLYDPVTKVAGMAHVMLPSSTLAKNDEFKSAKYADTALPELLQMVLKEGASKARLVAKMAGGAQMFNFAGGSDTMKIGPRNVEACKEALKKLGIRLIAEDTGGNSGRTVELFTETGVYLIKTASRETREI